MSPRYISDSSVPRSRLIWLVSAVGICLTLSFSLFFPVFITAVDNIFQDTMVRLNAQEPALESVVIIDINDDSLSAVGQ